MTTKKAKEQCMTVQVGCVTSTKEKIVFSNEQ